jgi:GAF domain-containing protein
MRYDPGQFIAVLSSDQAPPERSHPQLGGPDLPEPDLRLGERIALLIETAARLLGAAGSGLMMLDDQERLRCVGASDAGSRTLEAAQLREHAGPGWDAMWQGRPVAVVDLADHPRYRQLAAGLIGVPVRAVLAVPLTVAGQCAGVLHFYRPDAAAWTEAQSVGGTAFAGVISALLTQAVESRHRHAAVLRLLRLLDPSGATPPP